MLVVGDTVFNLYMFEIFLCETAKKKRKLVLPVFRTFFLPQQLGVSGALVLSGERGVPVFWLRALRSFWTCQAPEACPTRVPTLAVPASGTQPCWPASWHWGVERRGPASWVTRRGLLSSPHRCPQLLPLLVLSVFTTFEAYQEPLWCLCSSALNVVFDGHCFVTLVLCPCFLYLRDYLHFSDLMVACCFLCCYGFELTSSTSITHVSVIFTDVGWNGKIFMST